MPEIPELRQQRGVPKGQLTRLENWLQERAEDATYNEINTRLSYLDSIVENFLSIQVQLEVMDPAEVDRPDRAEFEDRMFTVKSHLLDLKQECMPETKLDTSAIQNLSIDVCSTPDLPPIQVPTFHGDYFEYPAFMDSFTTLVHDNQSKNMNDIKRFALLKSSCKGKALDTIKDLMMTAQNYPIALDLLKSRFDKRRLTVEALLKRIWEISRANNVSTLRKVSDEVNTHLRALRLIATEAQIAAGLLIYICLTKCDERTITKWEQISASKDELPDWDEFSQWLQKRCTELECAEYATKSVSPKPSSSSKCTSFKTSKPDSKLAFVASNPSSSYSTTKSIHPSSSATVSSNSSVTEVNSCLLCHGSCSSIATCNTFLSKDPHDRYNCVKELKCCVRCLSTDHRSCRARCDLCKKFHHTKLHFFNASPTSSSGDLSLSANACKLNQRSTSNYTLLGTAIVKVQTANGENVFLRALLDSGSQLNFIAQPTAKLLGLPVLGSSIVVSGINGTSEMYSKSMVLTISSLTSTFKSTISAVVHPAFDQVHPTTLISTLDWKIPDTVRFADPSFFKPGPIQLILNADLSYRILEPQHYELGHNQPILQNTKFGFVVVGNVSTSSASLKQHQSHEAIVLPQLTHLVEKFWQQEEIQPVKSVLSPEEKYCEAQFCKTFTRLDSGRFVLRLPLLTNVTKSLGQSRPAAISRLINIEKKLSRDVNYANQYYEFMAEYEGLGHMTEIEPPASNTPHYYLPHFGVINETSTTTKLRVVFDGSCPTDSGYSLNDCLQVGPTVQRDLFAHLISFRCHKVAISADVSKMYRQVQVHESDKLFQLIVWRRPQQKHISTFKLNTITYGTSSAPFAAIRCLMQLASEAVDLEVGASCIRNNFYVDDMLAGGSTTQEALSKYEEAKLILSRGQFQLKKLMSNDPEVVKSVPESARGTYVTIGNKEVSKALGMIWMPLSDSFNYYYESSETSVISKRQVLSETSRLFDPLGLVQPVIVKAKIFLQHLWTLKVEWDTPLQEPELSMWREFRSQLPHISEMHIPRFVINGCTPVEVQLHGFSDASAKAYGAAIYVRSSFHDGRINIRLLTSKTRVAPLKVVSLARLELCGALLLSQLWVTFVATRVSDIQKLTPNCTWRHVPGDMNPADIASRGLWPKELMGNQMWFAGPPFLKQHQSSWPQTPALPHEVPEVQSKTFAMTSQIQIDLVAACKFHSYNKVRKVFAYVHKFISNLKLSKVHQTQNQTSLPQKISKLTVDDLERGLHTAIKAVQQSAFHKELQLLQSSAPSLKTLPSYLRKLGLLIDEGIIKVGGRLVNAPELSAAEKFPILLPKDHPLSRSIVLWAHHSNLHCGPASLLAFVRRKFWIIGAKVLANKICHSCPRCIRAKPLVMQQIMANLPKERVQRVAKPFAVTGVDLCGPFVVHHKGRGSRTTQVFMAVFICFSVKAVHLELVDNLSTEAFLNALRRFVSRRGAPHQIWSDNGRNFLGAKNVLLDVQQNVFHQTGQDAIFEWCRSEKNIEWKMIPPYAPNFGGLWEAGVKFAKYHLKRVVGTAKLIYDDLCTMIAMVEAVLNSRPLFSLSMDPKDGQPLTPGHFLIGTPITALPEPDLYSPTNYVERHHRLIALLGKQARK